MMTASSTMTDVERFELSDRIDAGESTEPQVLPRADGGTAAWATLFACVCLEFVVWG